MTDAEPASRSGNASGGAKSDSDELESLREEAKRLRQLVVQLSTIAIRNAVNLK